MTSKKRSPVKKFPVWFYVILILIPFLFVILLESGLRFFNYGKDFTTFVEISDQFSNTLFFNPKLPQKFFSSSVPIPSVIPDGFDKIKKENTFRIFVLGESTVAGFPYLPNASFPRFLKRKLQMVFPSNNIEVINLGVSAVNTIFIRDIIDDVISQKPDLIIFYAGHNEYYGAYGAASNDLTSASPFFARLSVSLKDYKVFQLLINIIDWVQSVINKEKENNDGKTLMASMAGEKLVEKDSEVYKNGIEQFSENFEYIISECKKNNIKILTSTLTSNLRQHPLVTLTQKKHKSVKIFEEAEYELRANNLANAKKLFISSKDNDAVMFRAPERINEIIKELTEKYKEPLIKIDSVFYSKSTNGITGFDLFVDHLHPNISGYKIIADEFYKVIKDQNYVKTETNNFEREDEIEKILKYEFPFTRLDSVYSQIQIDLLLNSYPFKENLNIVSYFRNLKLKNLTDTLAAKAVLKEISWEDAHSKLAEYYFLKKDYSSFYKEANVLLEDKPFDRYTYAAAAEKLLSVKEYGYSKNILLKLFRNLPDKYSAKKLGDILLVENNAHSGIRFYNEALKFDDKDPELYFNLSKAYFKINDLENALLHIKKCLQISPDNYAAKKIHEFLLKSKTAKKK